MAESETRAFTLIEVLVVVGVLAVLAILFLPSHEAPATRINCASNLKQLGIASRVWAGDHGDHYPMLVSTNKGGAKEYPVSSDVFRYFQAVSNEVVNLRVLICPADNRKPAASFAALNNSNISYFIGLDADETFPGMPLAGDRNLTTNGVPVGPGLLVFDVTNAMGWSTNMHKVGGNVAMADGSVQQFSSWAWQQALQKSGTNIIRLGVP